MKKAFIIAASLMTACASRAQETPQFTPQAQAVDHVQCYKGVGFAELEIVDQSGALVATLAPTMQDTFLMTVADDTKGRSSRMSFTLDAKGDFVMNTYNGAKKDLTIREDQPLYQALVPLAAHMMKDIVSVCMKPKGPEI